MATHSTFQPERADASSDDIADCGFRLVKYNRADGTFGYNKIPLTEEEFLHPKEGYHLPNSTFHDDVASEARELLAARYAGDPGVLVFRDVLINWGDPALQEHCPDVCVVFGVRNTHANRRTFSVAREGVRPALIVEVVSPRYRKADREIKVAEYEQAQVQEYVIIDQRQQRGQTIEEVLGYRLVHGRYRPIAPDDEGRILCRTVGLWISMHNGQVVMDDASTGARLLSRHELEQFAREEQQARAAAEAENAALRAQLEALRAASDKA